MFYRVLAADGILGKKRARGATQSAQKSDDELDDEEELDLDESDVESGNGNGRVIASERQNRLSLQRTESTQTEQDDAATGTSSVGANAADVHHEPIISIVTSSNQPGNPPVTT